MVHKISFKNSKIVEVTLPILMIVFPVFPTLHEAVVLSYPIAFTCICHTVNGNILALIWVCYLQNVRSCCETIFTFNSLNIDFGKDNKNSKVLT